jgi:hypothetical protein
MYEYMEYNLRDKTNEADTYSREVYGLRSVDQCFSTAGPRSGTGLR